MRVTRRVKVTLFTGLLVCALVLSTVMLAGCGLIARKPSTNPPPKTTPPTAAEIQQSVTDRAQQVLAALGAGDMAKLAPLVHPDKGVRFSPYGHIRTGSDGDLVFKTEKLKDAMNDKTVYHWGVFDGSGNPIDKTFPEYMARFVSDKNYAAAPKTAHDQIIGKGNTLINMDAYPGTHFIEFHYPGTEKYGGMDWTSLRLVFEEKGGVWYLVGIIHDQWTI